MKQEYIRELNGNILGIIETDPNGNQTARDFPSYRILGYYNKQLNRTTTFLGQIVSQGNTVVQFIYQAKQGK